MGLLVERTTASDRQRLAARVPCQNHGRKKVDSIRHFVLFDARTSFVEVEMAKKMMPISSRWFQGAIITYLIGFTILGILAYLVYRDQPPLPARVVSGDKTVFTRDDIMNGMNVFQRNGLMEYGSIYGHGAYLGPDFTAEYLHKTSEFLAKTLSKRIGGRSFCARSG